MSKSSRDDIRLAGPIVEFKVERLRPHLNNPRVHKPKQVRQIADSIAKFGFTNPVLIDPDGGIIAGHGRFAAAKLLGLKSVPTLCLAHLTPAERRAYVIADNKLSDNSGFDRRLLADEVALILEDDSTFDLGVTGFDSEEIELLLDYGDSTPKTETPMPPPERDRPALTRPGDVWMLGRHRLICGNALERDTYLTLMVRERARLIFVDPTYDVPAKSISGKGRVVHGDFAMASGEMGGPNLPRS